MRRPGSFYRSLEEFEREEIRPWKKAGFCLDDLYSEAQFNPGEDNSLEERKELDFDY